MLRLPRGKIAAVPVFDTDNTGVLGVKGHVDPLGKSMGFEQGGDIKLLDKYRERVDQGIVKYVGDGVTVERFGFNIGDLIIFSGYTGELVSIEGEGLYILLPARFVVATVQIEPTQVSGLFFQGPEGDFFPATYEAALPLMAKAVEESEWRKINIKRFTPKLEEYDTHIEELTDDG